MENEWIVEGQVGSKEDIKEDKVRHNDGLDEGNGGGARVRMCSITRRQ